MPGDELEYGYVADRIVRAVGDTPEDENRLPDIVPAEGTIRFTPVAPIRRTEDPQATVIKATITCTIHQEGEDAGKLVDPAGHVGNVALVAGMYDVSYSFTDGSVPGFRIEVKPEHTNSDPLWLPEAAPLIPSPAERWVVNEQVYTETLAARDETIVARDATLVARDDATGTLAATYVALDIVDGHLIATRHDDDTTNLGNVEGPKGDPGDLLPSHDAGQWSGQVDVPAAWLPSTRHVTLTGDVTLSLPSPDPTISGTITLLVTQDDEGGHSLAIPDATTAWAVPIEPTPDPGATDLIHLLWTGTGWVALAGATNLGIGTGGGV